MMRRPPQRIANALAPYLNEFVSWLGAGDASFRRANPGAGIVYTSWWRDDATNAAEGGDEFSQHLLGLAVDTKPVKANAPPQELARLARELAWHFNVTGPGMTTVNEWATRRPHVHVQKSPPGVWHAVIAGARSHGVLGVPARYA